MTLKDVAERVGCSPSLVSHVLRGKDGERVRCSAERAAQIKQVARKLGYPFINDDASNRKVVGVVGPGLLESEPSTRVLRTFNEALDFHDCSLKLIEATREGYDSLTGGLLRRGDIQAVMCLHFPYPACVEQATAVNAPYLYVNAGPVEESNCIYLDDESGMVQLVRFLTRCGGRRVLYLAPPPHYTHVSAAVRTEALRRECRKAGIGLEVQVTESEVTPTFIEERVRGKADVLVNNCSRGQVGEVAAAIQASGINMPEELQLINITIMTDDETMPYLTRIKLPFADMARLAADRLLRMLELGETTCSNVKLPEHVLFGEV